MEKLTETYTLKITSPMKKLLDELSPDDRRELNTFIRVEVELFVHLLKFEPGKLSGRVDNMRLFSYIRRKRDNYKGRKGV